MPKSHNPPPPRSAAEASSSRISLGLIADTHGWVHPYLHDAFAGAYAILHAGDVGSWDVITELEVIAPVWAVRGNIDGGELMDLPRERVQEVGGQRIAMLHIGGSPRRPTPEARDLIQRARATILVCGHSHIPALSRVQGALLINPGAAGRHGFHKERTAALLHLGADGSVSLDRVRLGGRTAPGIRPASSSV